MHSKMKRLPNPCRSIQEIPQGQNPDPLLCPGFLPMVLVFKIWEPWENCFLALYLDILLEAN